MLRSLKWTLPFGFTVENVVCVPHKRYMYYPAHLIFPGLITPVTFGEE
jgi:hypothetical protein